MKENLKECLAMFLMITYVLVSVTLAMGGGFGLNEYVRFGLLIIILITSPMILRFITSLGCKKE